jgi:ketosteroid isomerase-like protein
MKSARTILWLLVLFAPATFAQPPNATEKELLAIENGWNDAIIKVDVAALEKLYAKEYVFIDTSGTKVTRAQVLGSVKSGEYVLKAAKLEDMTVHVYGNFATVTGINNETATDKGADASGAKRFTDVFVKRDGRWQCVATQATRVTKQP